MSRGGFTLIEVMLAIAILMVIFGLGLFASFDLYRGYSYRSERDTIVGLLTKARSRSMSNVYQSAHGVCYNASAQTYNIECVAESCPVSTAERIPANPSVLVSGIPSCGGGLVLFAQVTGNTSGPGVISVSEPGRPTQTITVNNAGTINW